MFRVAVPKTNSPEVASVRCWEEESASEVPKKKSKEGERKSAKEETI